MKQVLYGFGVAALLVLIGWQWQKNSSTKIENVTVTGPKPAEKVAYVTFDDGPSEITPGILDTLKKYDAKATFFLIGEEITEGSLIFHIHAKCRIMLDLDFHLLGTNIFICCQIINPMF